MSEGRGTALPFQQVGAPWVDGNRLAEAMNQLVAEGVIAGVVFRSITFTPSSSKYRGESCSGVMLHVTDRSAFRPVQAGLHLLATVIHHHLDKFEWLPYPTNVAGQGYGHFDRLLGRSDVRKQISELADGKQDTLSLQIQEWTSVSGWADRVAPHLLY